MGERAKNGVKKKQICYSSYPVFFFPGNEIKFELHLASLFLPVADKDEYDEKDRTARAQRRHVEYESAGADTGTVEKKQVLRASERHEQRAADRSDVFHRDYRKDAFFSFNASEKKYGERNEDYQRYVIGHEHRSEEYSEYQKERQRRHCGKS